MKCGYNQFTEPEHRQVSPILSKSYDWSLTLFSKGVSQLLGVSWDVHLSSTVFCDHLISGCTCRCDVARQPRDDSESPLNACLWERSLKKLQFIQITLDEKLKHLCCISISIVGFGFLHSNIKKVYECFKTQELTSVCPGSAILSDSETPFPLFSSAKETQKINDLNLRRCSMCGLQKCYFILWTTGVNIHKSI